MALSTNMLYVMSGELSNIKILGQVIKFAREHKASLTLLAVIESLPQSSRMLITSVSTVELRDNAVQNRLDELEALISRFSTESVTLRPRVLFGSQAREIVREAAAGGYDLVIKNPGKSRTDTYLRRDCSCPVWLLQPDDYDAAGQLIANRCPLFADRHSKPAVQYRMTAASRPGVRWISRAQALFR